MVQVQESGVIEQETAGPLATGATGSSLGGTAVTEEEVLIEDVSIDGMCGVY